MWPRLIFWLVVMVPAWAVFGGMADTSDPPWTGFVVGSAIGVFFGLVFGGNRKWRVWDTIFGPEQPGEEEK